MSISNYTELKSAIADWLLRTDLTSVIPTFISLAQAQINRDIRDHRMVTRATSSLDTEYFATPSDWLETIRYQINTSPVVTLEFVSPDQAAEEKIKFNVAGKPLFYTHIGSEMQVVPAPDSAYTSELTYYAKIPALSDSNSTNWLLDYAPDVYLYASLMQASPYLDDDQRLGVWASLYEKAVGALKVQDQRARLGSSSLKMRPRAIA